MNPTTLHLGDTDMIVFLRLIDKKMETIRRELFKKGLSTSKELEDLTDLKAQFMKSADYLISFNSF